MTKESQHYSYEEYAKKEIAEGFEQLRFGGPIGSLLRETQDKQLLRWIPDAKDLKILDIGAGTGRTAIPLALRGAEVTAADASEAMLEVAKKNAERHDAKLNFAVCDVMDLVWEDKSLDRVLCFRVLMHITDWKKGLSELCRVTNDELIFDYPARWSFAGLQVPWRSFKVLFDKTVQNFRLFSLRQMKQELHAAGFEIVEVEKLWAMPVAFHKVFGSRKFTLALEAVLAGIGLRRLFGSPVTIRARRIR